MSNNLSPFIIMYYTLQEDYRPLIVWFGPNNLLSLTINDFDMIGYAKHFSTTLNSLPF
jgi:hypothetical protein